MATDLWLDFKNLPITKIYVTIKTNNQIIIEAFYVVLFCEKKQLLNP